MKSMQYKSFSRLVLALVVVHAASSLVTIGAYAHDPFEEYDLVMFDRPGFPSPETQQVFSPGLKPLWIKALRRPDDELRRMVIDMIAIAHKQGMGGWEEIRTDLVDMLKNPDTSLDLVRAAASTLIALEAKDEAELLANVAISRGGTVAQIIEPALAKWKSPTMQDAWLQRVSEPNASSALRLLAIDGLAAIESTKASEALTKIVRNPSASVSSRMASARALGDINTSGLIDLAQSLKVQTSTPTELGSLLAVELLEHHTGEAASNFLTELLHSPSAAVQSRALGSLYRIDVNLVDPHVDDFIDSPDVTARRWCVRSMIATQKSKRVEALAKMLDDVNPSLRREVASGLLDLAKKPNLREEVLTQVSAVLSQDSWRGCEQACVVLARLDHKPAGQRMVELLGHERGEVKVASAWSLTQLRIEALLPDMLEHAQGVYDGFRSGQLNDAMPGFSLQVAHLFIALGDQRYRDAETLMRAYVPKNMTIGVQSRPAAVWALGLIFESEPKNDLVKLFVERLNDVESMEPEMEEVREMCAVSLGRMKAESAIPDLRKYAGGPALASRAYDWAIEQLTGEKPPYIGEPSVEEIDGWFLSPIPTGGS